MHDYSLPIYVAWFQSWDVSIVSCKINSNIVPYEPMKYVCATATSHNCAISAFISALANKQLAGGRKREGRNPIQSD